MWSEREEVRMDAARYPRRSTSQGRGQLSPVPALQEDQSLDKLQIVLRTQGG